MAKAYDRDGGGGGSSALRDIYLRHGINLTRYSNHQTRKLQEILDTANVQIRGIITKAKGIETKEKYRRVAAEVRRISKELGKQLNGQLELDFKELAEEESRFVENAVRNVEVTADFELPDPAKVWATASFGSYSDEGHETFETYLNGLGDNLYKIWDTNVKAGYLSGMTAQQINRIVLGNVNNLEPGQIQVLRKSLEMNTRTMVAHLAETARDSVYKANSSIFDGYRYVATLDSRTCLVCGELDGQKFETLEEAPQLPAHYNCRCLYIPSIKGMEDFDADDERASADGPVSANMTYNDWLKTQPDDVVKDILGATRFMAYKDGMNIGAFVSNGSVLNLEQLVAKEGLELFGAGLKDKSWQAQKAYSDTYYNSIRNRKNPTDIKTISVNTGFSQKNIQAIRNHIFIDEHDLGTGRIGRFISDWQIAQAWQRMEQGWSGNRMDRYREYDILLLRHELEELTIISKFGYNTIKAHELAEEKYPWDIRIREVE